MDRYILAMQCLWALAQSITWYLTPTHDAMGMEAVFGGLAYLASDFALAGGILLRLAVVLCWRD